jgi:hypothetical protein
MNSLLKMKFFKKKYQSVKQKEKMANLKFLEKVLCSPYNLCNFYLDPSAWVFFLSSSFFSLILFLVMKKRRYNL